MKNSFKKIFGLLLIATLLLGAMLAVSSCGDKDKVTEIYILKADLPRVDYVEGQELDLSKGKLTVVVNGEETKIPLTAPEVTVSGYDKDVIGKQTVTVQYQEFTTTFNVTVLERAVAENYETKYFVYSEFNPLKGKIRITPDDGKPFTVNMNDSKVSLVSFDSSVAGEQTVTVVYFDGVNAYYCQFDVMVYEQSNIEFTAPKNNDYQSHYDGVPNVSGGYFHVTSADGTLEMNVPVTESMVEGFDVSAATIANRTEPLEQKLTVNYLGREFYYSVYITFSGVSAVNHYVNETLSKIDWVKAEADGFNDEQSAAAISAITEYYALTDNEKALLSDSTKELIAKSGAVALSHAFFTEVETYKNSFVYDLEGSLYFLRTSYELTYADVQRLNNPKEKINVYSDLLRKILAEFGNVALTETAKISDFIMVYSEEDEAMFKSILNHFVDVFVLVKDIPKDWTKETLAQYGDNLISVAMQIYDAGHYKSGKGAYYTSILSPWREKNDLFEILYTYFLYVYEDGSEFMSKYMWGTMPMPGLLDDWYQGIKTCMEYCTYYKAYASAGYNCVDMSAYMYTYFYTLEIVDQIKASGDQFLIDIYYAYNGDNMNFVYLYSYNYGYFYNVSGMIDSETFHKLWAEYYNVLKLYNNKTLSAELHKNELQKLYAEFEKLTPAELLGFLSSFNLLYTNGAGKYPMLGFTVDASTGKENVYNYFSLILANYYATYMTEGNELLFNELLSAMESYVLIGYKEGALEEFNTKMEALSAKITALVGDDKANYEQYFQTLFEKYLAIYQLTSKKVTVEFTEAEAELVEQFMDTATKYFTVYSLIYEILQSGYSVAEDVYPILYALYAQASELRADFMSIASEQALLAMYSEQFEIGTTMYTLEQTYYMMDTLTVSIFGNQTAIVPTGDGKLAYATYWDLYEDFGMQEILAEISDILYAAYFTNGKAVTHADYLAFMQKLRGFDKMTMSVINLMSIDDTFYHSLTNFYATLLTEEGKTANAALVKLALAYTSYTLDSSETNLTALLDAMDAAETAYAAATEADKAYIGEMYNYYAALVEALAPTTEAA